MCYLEWHHLVNPVGEELLGVQVDEENIKCVGYYYGLTYDEPFSGKRRASPREALLNHRRPSDLILPGMWIAERIHRKGYPLYLTSNAVDKHMTAWYLTEAGQEQMKASK